MTEKKAPEAVTRAFEELTDQLGSPYMRPTPERQDFTILDRETSARLAGLLDRLERRDDVRRDADERAGSVAVDEVFTAPARRAEDGDPDRGDADPDDSSTSA